METTLYNISQVLGVSIIQSLWQGMLVYLVLRIVFAAAPSLSSVKKYYLGIFAMVSVFALFIYSLVSEAGARSWAVSGPHHFAQLLPGFNLNGNAGFSPDYYARFATSMPYICAIYFAGLLGNLAKLGWEWNKIRLIKRSVISAEQMQQFINKFSKKLDIRKRIQLKFSNLIDVPCMTGYFKPLILLPVSLSTHLSACEIESILLHELAHIKRNDYLVNLLQQAVSVMLFFNPFSRLINRLINQERENSCDDLVVEKTGKPLIYAQALLKLETARAHEFQLALAVTGKKFYLLKRIERIMKTQDQIGNMRHFFIAALLLAGGLCSIAWFNPVYGKLKADKLPKSTNAYHLSAVAMPDTTEYLNTNDTVKHKKKLAKTKTLTKKHAVVKKSPETVVYDYSDDTTGYFHSPEWKSQMAAIQKQAEELKKQFNSPEWKAQQEQWKKMGEEMKKQFDSPEWKKHMADLKSQTLAMQKQFNSPEWKAQQEQWKKQAEDIKKQFNSPEWKAHQEQWKKQAEEFKKQFNSPEWKAHQEEWKKQAEDLKKQFDSPEWKAQQEEWKKQAEDFKKQFNSPEWKAQQEQWKKQAEQFKNQFKSKEWKQQMEQLKDMSKELQKQFDGKAWKDSFKNQKWMLKDSTGGIDIYKPAKKDTLGKQ
ncbi:MAG TPA: M56 family metallopeptidase [Mucilaginibacter sp.]|nr:M56 family metallopeptidase [Mucilaginibacter sp.]